MYWYLALYSLTQQFNIIKIWRSCVEIKRHFPDFNLDYQRLIFHFTCENSISQSYIISIQLFWHDYSRKFRITWRLIVVHISRSLPLVHNLPPNSHLPPKFPFKTSALASIEYFNDIYLRSIIFKDTQSIGPKIHAGGRGS